MTDAADKLFAAVHEYAGDTATNDWPLKFIYADGARAKLLEAVDEYSGLARTRISELLSADLVRNHRLLEAKARVYDAVIAWEPEENRNSTSWARVSEALRAVRELEKTR